MCSTSEKYVVAAAGESAYEYGFVVCIMNELPKKYHAEIRRGSFLVYAKFTGPEESTKKAAAELCNKLKGVHNANKMCIRFLAHMIKSPYMREKAEATELLVDMCCLDLDRISTTNEQRLAISRLCTVDV